MIVRNMNEATNGARLEGTSAVSQKGFRGGMPTRSNDNSSASSTPFVSAPSSPGNSGNLPSASFVTSGYAGRGREAFNGGRSALTSGVSLTSMVDGMEIRSKAKPAPLMAETDDAEDFLAFSAAGSDFDFSARFSEVDGSLWSPAPMSSADELFYNGQIRPLQLFSPVQLESGVAKAMASRGDEGFFDFRSSANYTLPSPRSPATPPKQALRKQGRGLTKPPSPVSPSTSDPWQKVEKESGRKVSVDVATMGVADLIKAKAPPSSGRMSRAREGTHRRARSLSPLRVFHIDDQPRLSFESDSVNPTSGLHDVEKDSCKAAGGGETKARKGWTLRELLHGGDSRVYESSLPKVEKSCNKGGEKCVAKENAKKNSRKASPAASTSVSTNSKSVGSKQQVISPHEQHYTTQRAQAEQMRKRTSLPYRQGLLGCLGFSSRNYRPFAGHPMNPSGLS